jgi:hypothetical protein
MKTKIVIVGAGPAGIFTALELLEKMPDSQITLFEKGRSITRRVCPKRTTGECVHCRPCNITTGFSGAGAFSDGKLSLSPYVGGLDQYVEEKHLQELIDYTYSRYYEAFGADSKTYGTDNEDMISELKLKAIQANLRLIDYPLKHLGTEQAYEVYSRIQSYLEKRGVTLVFETKVEDIIVEEGRIRGVVVTGNEKVPADDVIITVGREGSQWFQDLCRRQGIRTAVNPVDVGVRVEVKNEIMAKINEFLYEGKLVYYTDTYDDKVRTFCQNPSGFVAVEHYEHGLATVNGHSYKNTKSDNTNFALLVSNQFDTPFHEPIEYGKKVAALGNMLADGKILVQRFGDFIRGRRTTHERLKRGNITPTMPDAEPGDLGHAIPYRTMLNIKETILALDKLIPGLASDETLMYGVEVKFYSNKVDVTGDFETSISRLYAGGDGAGLTRGLMHASVNGIMIARAIAQREKKNK